MKTARRGCRSSASERARGHRRRARVWLETASSHALQLRIQVFIAGPGEIEPARFRQKDLAMGKVTIACAQIDVRLGDASYNRDTIITKLRAAAASAALVVFPECALTGFCHASLDEAARRAESREGASGEQISEACRRQGVHAD